MRLRPHIYPADNARQRIASCKQELVRSQSMAPVYQQTIRELDRLKDENAQLRRQLQTLQAHVASQFVAPASLGNSSQQTVGSGAIAASKAPAEPIDSPIVVVTNNAAPLARERPAQPSRAFRTHTVRARETLYSIARRYDIKVDALQAANPGLDARRVRVGQTINVPQR